MPAITKWKLNKKHINTNVTSMLVLAKRQTNKNNEKTNTSRQSYNSRQKAEYPSFWRIKQTSPKPVLITELKTRAWRSTVPVSSWGNSLESGIVHYWKKQQNALSGDEAYFRFQPWGTPTVTEQFWYCHVSDLSMSLISVYFFLNSKCSSVTFLLVGKSLQSSSMDNY